jgi:hypothetical protein
VDLYNKSDLKEFLVSVFGVQAQSWNMNEEVFNLTHEFVRKTGKCSSAIDTVPNPMGPGQSAYSYLSSLARGYFLKYINQNKEQYVICTTSIARDMVRRFQLASMGL